ncbi:MAG: dioxygenase, partial [Chloroflexi bacterium]|nr:dioxygenase [Chloroflexota bacterium]
PVLTTQLYFPGEPGNANDGIFHPDLVMDVQETAGGREATFNFVLDIA